MKKITLKLRAATVRVLTTDQIGGIAGAAAGSIRVGSCPADTCGCPDRSFKEPCPPGLVGVIAMLLCVLLAFTGCTADASLPTASASASALSCNPLDPGSCTTREINEDTAAVVVPDVLEQVAGDISYGMSCGWDRCGPSGGYACEANGWICLWQRGTTWISCGYHCLPDRPSYACYGCRSGQY